MNKATLLLLSLICGNAMAKDVLAVLSPQGHTQQQVTTLLELLPKLEGGENIKVLSGIDGNTIASLHVPENKALQTPKALFKFNQASLAKLLQFGQQAKASDALNLPHVLGEIALYHHGYDDVLILGNASFNMEEGHYPSDDNLQRLPSESHFGTRGIGERLKAYRIHWLLPKASDDVRFAKAAERFWHLYLHNQSAKLVSYTYDKDVVIPRLLSDAAPLPMTYHMSVSAAPLPETQHLQLGISWQGAEIDLDIYALSQAQDLPVYYANSYNGLARHFKDIVTGSSSVKLFETIQYQSAIDVCSVMVGINFYSGKAQTGVSGTLNIQYGDTQFQHEFHIPAPKGNKGKDSLDVLKRNTSSAHSLRYALAEFLPKQECKA